MAGSGGKIQHDAELKNAAQAFFAKARAARCTTKEERHAALASGRFETVEGATFARTQELDAQLGTTVDRAITLLGKAWHEEDLAHLAWEHATQEGVAAPAMARAFAGHIDALSRTPAVYLTPNIVLALYDDIRELTIGRCAPASPKTSRPS